MVFHDALYIPGSGLDRRTNKDRPYAVDVLTVHQKSYYDAKGWNAHPNDWENPVPVSFLTVRPGARFLLAASGPDAWVRLAFSLLRDALVEWGVGGKTTSGYGHIRQDGWKQIWPVAGAMDSPDAPTSVIAEFRDWLSKSLDQRPKLDLLRTEWLERLRGCNATDKEEAARLIRKEIRSRKLVELRDALIRDIMGPGSDEKTT